MTTVDTNILVSAANADDENHEASKTLLNRLAAGPELLTLFWPTLLGFVRIVTHPRVFRHPLSFDVAFAAVDRLTARRHVRVLGEADDFWPRFGETARSAKASGNLVPDAHLATLMRQHGIREIWTNDRDFRKFDGIVTLDPFAHTVTER